MLLSCVNKNSNVAGQHSITHPWTGSSSHPKHKSTHFPRAFLAPKRAPHSPFPLYKHHPLSSLLKLNTHHYSFILYYHSSPSSSTILQKCRSLPATNMPTMIMQLALKKVVSTGMEILWGLSRLSLWRVMTTTTTVVTTTHLQHKLYMFGYLVLSNL